MNRDSLLIILASASPRRRDLLMQVGINPQIEPSHVQEQVTDTRPDIVVQQLSRQKAQDIAGLHRGERALVIGADTVVSADGQILGKPNDEAEAIRMITSLQGRTHQVYTGVTMIWTENGRSVTFSEETQVSVYPMTPEQIRAYAESGEPLDKAGAYGIQGLFAAYVRGICGDYNNVVGLPVGRVCQELMRGE